MILSRFKSSISSLDGPKTWKLPSFALLPIPLQGLFSLPMTLWPRFENAHWNILAFRSALMQLSNACPPLRLDPAIECIRPYHTASSDAAYTASAVAGMAAASSSRSSSTYAAASPAKHLAAI